MSSSLGLAGDLDDVELIEDVEEAFGFRLSDDELRRCRTVGDLFKLVERRLPESLGASCATAMCFYRLRRALQHRVATELRPKTAIGELGSLSVRSLHRIIREECGLRPPPQYLSVWGCIALALVVALPVGMLALGLAWWVAAASAAPAITLYRVAPIRLPEGVSTFGDLVHLVSSRSIGTLSQQGARLKSSEAWSAFRSILSEHSVLPQDAIAPDTTIYYQRKVAF